MADTQPQRRCAGNSDIGTILRLGWPNSVTNVLNFLPGLVMYNFLGTDPNDLAAAGMGFMFVNVTGQSFIMGTGIGSVTLASQAFGARNFERCGEILQRQLAIHVILILAIAVGWIRCEEILLALGQPGVIAARTAQFVLWRLPALPCIAVMRDFQCYLLAQRIMRFPMVVGVCSNLFSIACFAVFIPWLGFIGAPLAITVANALYAVSLVVFTRRYLPHQEAWPRWSLRTALSGWREMLMMGLPAGALQLGEWWAWESNLFFAGRLCSSESMCAELDVFPIVSSTMVILFCFHNGFNLAAGAMVGNALGAGDPARARRISRQDMLLVVFIAGMLALGLFMLRHEWGRFFVKDEQIIDLTTQVLPWVAMYVFVDSLGPGALVNVLRNAGVVKLPVAITFVAFYFIGIPCGLALAFPAEGPSWGVVGLWAGLVIGLTTQVSSLMVFFHCCLDWQQLADAAQARSIAADTGQAAKAVPAKGKSSYQQIATDTAGRDAENGGKEACSYTCGDTLRDASPDESSGVGIASSPTALGKAFGHPSEAG